MGGGGSRLSKAFLIVFVLQEQIQSATFSSDGGILIVGCVSGKWLVMDSETREIYSMHSDGSEPIQVGCGVIDTWFEAEINGCCAIAGCEILAGWQTVGVGLAR